VGFYQITVKFKITAKVGFLSNKCFWNITCASLAGNDLGRGSNQRHPLPKADNVVIRVKFFHFSEIPKYFLSFSVYP
jgi:hypothetical protein